MMWYCATAVKAAAAGTSATCYEVLLLTTVSRVLAIILHKKQIGTIRSDNNNNNKNHYGRALALAGDNIWDASRLAAMIAQYKGQ